MYPVTAWTRDCTDSLLVSGIDPCSLRMRGNPEHPVTSSFTCAKIKRRGGGANQLVAAEIIDMGDCAAFYSRHVHLEN